MAEAWAALPFWFWTVVFFLMGTIVGSFLNVCIHRLPRGESIISPPSHCPHCAYSIPWYLNIPLLTWLWLRGKCANCGAGIAARYFLVELLTGLLFMGAWLTAGRQSFGLAAVYCLFLGGLIAATFIDFEHYIIPDEITLGGMAAGFLCSLAVPALQGVAGSAPALWRSAVGMAVGLGLIYLVVWLGKLAFGRQRLELAPDSRVVFTETALLLPEKEIPYEELFCRKSDTITIEARQVELVDRCYGRVQVQLSPEKLRIGEDSFDPEQTPHMEVLTEKMVLPREAMGLGDVKFMGAIGAFLGWQAVIFSLMVSSVIGAVVGLVLILLRKREWSGRMPYGPYIALAAAGWLFGGQRLVAWWLTRPLFYP